MSENGVLEVPASGAGKEAAEGLTAKLQKNFNKVGTAMTAITIALLAKNTMDTLRSGLESRSRVIAETKNGYGTGQRY